MVNELDLPEPDPLESDPLEPALTHALVNALRAPAVPAELRARVFAAVAREPVRDIQRQRRDLESEYRRSIAALNARYLKLCRDALLAGLSLVVPIGLGVKPLVRALQGWFEGSAPLVGGLLALLVGLLYGAVLLRELFARGSIGLTRAQRAAT